MLDFYRLLTGSQGSMGIVTWASLKCEAASPVHKVGFVAANKMEDLVDFVYRVIRLRLGNEMLILNKTALASLVAVDKSDFAAAAAELPAWAAVVGISGQSLLPEKRAEAHSLDISDIAQQFGLKFVNALPGLSGESVYKKLVGSCGKESWKAKKKGSFAELFFTTTLDRVGEFEAAMQKMAIETG